MPDGGVPAPPGADKFEAPKKDRMAFAREVRANPERFFPYIYKPVENSLYGVRYEALSQLEDFGFSFDRIATARKEKQLANKVYIVAGANPNGIGGATAEEIVAEGGIVVATSRKSPDDSVAQQMLGRLGEVAPNNKSSWVQMDITKRESRNNAIEKVLEKHGRIDGVVLTVGQINDHPYVDLSEDQLIELYEANLIGPDMFLHGLAKYVQKVGGVLKAVEHATIAGPGNKDQGSYPGAKEAMNSRMRGLSMEGLTRKLTGETNYDLYANSLSIGFVANTELTQGVTFSEGRRISRDIGGVRLLERAEVAVATAWLLNPDVMVNGRVIPMVPQQPFVGLDERGLLKVA